MSSRKLLGQLPKITLKGTLRVLQVLKQSSESGAPWVKLNELQSAIATTFNKGYPKQDVSNFITELARLGLIESDVWGDEVLVYKITKDGRGVVREVHSRAESGEVKYQGYIQASSSPNIDTQLVMA
jgi:hypothetical protein